MLTNENLAFVRLNELEILSTYIQPGRDVLEIGAGTGLQSKLLAERGFRVTAIDIPSSGYKSQRVFPVQDYDGLSLPFPDCTFDVVFSSNVLEHVRDLPSLLWEMRRVLRPDGHCVHAMPTPTWRIWSTITGYFDLPIYLVAALRRDRKAKMGLLSLVKGVLGRLVPVSHGKIYPALVELWSFSRGYWKATFLKNGFEVIDARPLGLFYTGWSLFGSRLSATSRRRLATTLGSACYVYKLRVMPVSNTIASSNDSVKHA
jgi:SAM-dependent methyltransferase